MSKYLIKIIGAAVLVTTAVITAKVFWPAGSTPTTEPSNLKLVEEKHKSSLNVQLSAQQQEEKKTVDEAQPERIETIQGENPKAEKLYQMALSHRERDNPSDVDFRIMADCCRKILTDYPESPEAEKATELLQEVPERYLRLSVAQVASKPAVRKSRSLRRRVSRSYPEPHYILREDVDRQD